MLTLSTEREVFWAAKTSDTYITSFEGDPSNVIGNGFALYVGGVALDGIQ